VRGLEQTRGYLRVLVSLKSGRRPLVASGLGRCDIN
jgi:hypothetical protein